MLKSLENENMQFLSDFAEFSYWLHIAIYSYLYIFYILQTLHAETKKKKKSKNAVEFLFHQQFCLCGSYNRDKNHLLNCLGLVSQTGTEIRPYPLPFLFFFNKNLHR